MRIGELAATTAVSPDTLRYYERLGLLAAPARTAGGFRSYDAAAIEQVRFVRQAQALGLELSEIRQLGQARGPSGVKECREVQPLLEARLAELDARIAELRGLRKTLSRALRSCEQRLAERPDAACPVVERLEQEATAQPRHLKRVRSREGLGRPRRGRRT